MAGSGKKRRRSFGRALRWWSLFVSGLVVSYVLSSGVSAVSTKRRQGSVLDAGDRQGMGLLTRSDLNSRKAFLTSKIGDKHVSSRGDTKTVVEMSPGLWIALIFAGGIVACILLFLGRSVAARWYPLERGSAGPLLKSSKDNDHPVGEFADEFHESVEEEIRGMKRMYYATGCNDLKLWTQIQDAEIEYNRRCLKEAISNPNAGIEDIRRLEAKLSTLQTLRDAETRANAEGDAVPSPGSMGRLERGVGDEALLDIYAQAAHSNMRITESLITSPNSGSRIKEGRVLGFTD